MLPMMEKIGTLDSVQECKKSNDGQYLLHKDAVRYDGPSLL